MENVAKPVLSALEASKYLGLPRNRIYKLCNIEGFPVIKIGKRKLIPKEGLDKWIKESVGKKIEV